jgi:hypothetical protein
MEMTFSGFFRGSAFNMRACCTNSVLLLLAFCLSGCKTTPRRPANVPASAVRIEGVFIDCSVEETSYANRCTVYKEVQGRFRYRGCSRFLALAVKLAEPSFGMLHSTAREYGCKMPGPCNPFGWRSTRPLAW